jgi:hypothetical protein
VGNAGSQSHLVNLVDVVLDPQTELQQGAARIWRPNFATMFNVAISLAPGVQQEPARALIGDKNRVLANKLFDRSA